MNFAKIQIQITNNYRTLIFTIVALMYFVGFVGLKFTVTQAYFKLLSPFNLWTSLILLLLFHQDFQAKFITFAIITFLSGFFIEVIGVHTGLIFGEYQYGKTLGLKLFEVPIVIGANWLILVYSTGVVSEKLLPQFKESLLGKIILSCITAALMVGLDCMIEPVAIRLDFWQWSLNTIPVQNFIGWFVISFFLAFYFINSTFLKANLLAPLLFCLQVMFFLLHTVFPT